MSILRKYCQEYKKWLKKEPEPIYIVLDHICKKHVKIAATLCPTARIHFCFSSGEDWHSLVLMTIDEIREHLYMDDCLDFLADKEKKKLVKWLDKIMKN
jgi:hypothetical protein